MLRKTHTGGNLVTPGIAEVTAPDTWQSSHHLAFYGDAVCTLILIVLALRFRNATATAMKSASPKIKVGG